MSESDYDASFESSNWGLPITTFTILEQELFPVEVESKKLELVDNGPPITEETHTKEQPNIDVTQLDPSILSKFMSGSQEEDPNMNNVGDIQLPPSLPPSWEIQLPARLIIDGNNGKSITLMLYNFAPITTTKTIAFYAQMLSPAYTVDTAQYDVYNAYLVRKRRNLSGERITSLSQKPRKRKLKELEKRIEELESFLEPDQEYHFGTWATLTWWVSLTGTLDAKVKIENIKAKLGYGGYQYYPFNFANQHLIRPLCIMEERPDTVTLLQEWFWREGDDRNQKIVYNSQNNIPQFWKNRSARFGIFPLAQDEFRKIIKVNPSHFTELELNWITPTTRKCNSLWENQEREVALILNEEREKIFREAQHQQEQEKIRKAREEFIKKNKKQRKNVN